MVYCAHPSPQPKRHLDQFSRFCTAYCSVPILYNGLTLPPSKLPLPMGHLDSHPWANQSPQPKQHLNRFSHFCRAHYCDRQTGRQTDHATRSVTIGHIYVCSTAMWPNNNNKTTKNESTAVHKTNGGSGSFHTHLRCCQIVNRCLMSLACL